ncbi:MAG: hypothetical protein R6U59_08185 [Eubacteriales bacterium]
MVDYLRPTPKSIILEIASKKGQVVYGQQSINQQLPPYLRRETKDYDILTKKPKQEADMLAYRLNRIYGNKYKVKPAKHRGTYKVKDIDTGETIADYTSPRRPPKSKNLLGVKYADTDYAKRKIKKILKDDKSKYRWEKDKDVLERIKKVEKKIW